VTELVHQTDQALIEDVLSGRQEAFAELYRRYYHLVRNRIYGVVKSHDFAEDLVQEVFILAYNHLDRLRNPPAFKPWLMAIARNQCVSALRQRRIKTVSLDELALQGFEPAARNYNGRFSEEQSQSVELALEHLRPVHREILKLHYGEGLSYLGICERLGITLSTVRARLFHARKQLIRLMESEGWL
jgi:RNA polymerase sigma-70 factor (ECF subfamily)